MSTRLQELKLLRAKSPLSLYLAIYSKAEHECNINYMEGAKALYAWLTSNSAVPLDYQLRTYPDILDTKFKVPRLLQGYTSSELAQILTSHIPTVSTNGSMGEKLAALKQAKRAIYVTLVQRGNHQ